MIRYCLIATIGLIATILGIEVPTEIGGLNLSYGKFSVTHFPKADFQDAVDQEGAAKIFSENQNLQPVRWFSNMKK